MPSLLADEKEDRRFDDLIHLFDLYTKMQMDVETLYYNRSNLILVAEGLLLVAFPSALDRKEHFLSQLLAALGTWLSLIWLILEQRHQLHNRARKEGILIPLEAELTALAERAGRAFRGIWSVHPVWVNQQARWYERHAVRRILRTYTPLTFLTCWVAILIYTTIQALP